MRLLKIEVKRDADPAGLMTFTTALQQGAPTEVILSIIAGSDEYIARLFEMP